MVDRECHTEHSGGCARFRIGGSGSIFSKLKDHLLLYQDSTYLWYYILPHDDVVTKILLLAAMSEICGF